MSTIDSNKQAVDFVARWAWREPSNPDKPISDAERLSAIKYHPAIKTAWSGAAEGNEAEAAAPKPDPAIAELVERLERAKGTIGRLRLGPNARDLYQKDRQAIDDAIAALTASNVRVAEMERMYVGLREKALDDVSNLTQRAEAAERERDEARKLAHRWAAQAGDADVRAVAAEAEVSRLKAGTVTGRFRIEHDGFVGDAIGSYTRRDGKRGIVLQQDGTNVCHLYGEKWCVPIDALSNQAGASK